MPVDEELVAAAADLIDQRFGDIPWAGGRGRRR